MNSKLVIFAFLFTGFLILGSVQLADGAQLAVNINPQHASSAFEMKYQKTVIIEYEEGGQIADALRGLQDSIEFTADTSNPGVADLENNLNRKLANDGSGSQIDNLNVDYSVKLTGRGLNAAIDYKVVLTGDLTGYTIRAAQGQAPALIDLGWRGMTATGPIVINGQDVNIMFAAIQALAPSVASAMAGTEAETILSQNLINAEGIKDQPLGNWHFLFDPTGINVDAAQFGLAEEIKGFVISGFTMGESSIREGRQIEQVQEAQFTADKTYVVRAIQAADNANLRVIGFATVDNLEGLEIVGVTPTPPEGYATAATGGFPVMIIYGMAGIAVVAGGAFFIISGRKLKQLEGQQGQTGIDPSQLRAYATSAGAGGYQTVRGEAQLIDDSDYQKTRSVYEETTQQQSAPPPAIASSEEATCGCATSAEMGSECDCEMQGSCLCDATCKCNAQVCKDQVQSMS